MKMLVIEDDRVGIDLLTDECELLSLAAPDVGRGIEPISRLDDARHLIGAGGIDEE